MDWLLFLTFLAVLIALFGADFVKWLKRPNLKLSFDRNDKSHWHRLWKRIAEGQEQEV